MSVSRIWKKGDLVTVTSDGRTVEGEVFMASPNGISLFIAFDAMLHGMCGSAPLLWREAGEFRDIVTDSLFVLEERAI